LEYLIGLAVALAVIGLAAGVGFGRDRSFAPTVLIVVAHYYVLYAILGGGGSVLVIESLIASAFLLAAVIGFKMSPTLVAGAMVGHGVFDMVHGSLIHNPGLPVYWPGFCMAFDIGYGAWLVALLVRRRQMVL